MLQGVNIEEIKQYNSSLKQYRDRAATLKAEIEYTNKEIDNLCKELSAELGVQVTRENIEQIYNEQIEKINTTLKTGNAILSKIASEESGASETAQSNGQNNVQPAPAPSMSVGYMEERPNMQVESTSPFGAFAQTGQTGAIPNFF